MRRVPAAVLLLAASVLGASTATSAAPAPPAAVACPATPPRATLDPARPRYEVTVDVRPDRLIATGTVKVTFTPDLAVDELVFRLWPNGPSDAWSRSTPLVVTALTLDGSTGAVPVRRPDPSTLVVPLGRTVPAGQAIDVHLAWTLRLPGTRDDRISRTGDAIRLGSFFPILAWEPGHGWSRTPPTTSHAEASMAPAADLALRVTTAPGLQVVATGVLGADGWWRASGARDAAVSIGRFRTASTTITIDGGGPVAVTAAVAAGIGESPDAYLARVARALRVFSARYGPYPWPSYTVVLTPGLVGGIEYPTMAMQGPGSGGRSTPHEVAHQWFYALVGNDQGRDPWLDEGLASWAEAQAEGTLAAFRAKDVPAAARNRIGAPMTYWDTTTGAYYRGAYVQPVQALATLGTPAAVDCVLRAYVAAQAFRIARPSDLVSALTAAFPDAPAVLARYGLRTTG